MASNSLVATALALAASLLLNACLLWTLGYSPKRQSINSETDASFELPDGWWSSAERFAAERRAIFSQVHPPTSCLQLYTGF